MKDLDKCLAVYNAISLVCSVLPYCDYHPSMAQSDAISSASIRSSSTQPIHQRLARKATKRKNILTTRNIPIPRTTQRHLRLGPPQQRSHGFSIVPVWLFGWRGAPSCGRRWWREDIDGTESVFVFDSLRYREEHAVRGGRGEGREEGAYSGFAPASTRVSTVLGSACSLGSGNGKHTEIEPQPLSSIVFRLHLLISILSPSFSKIAKPKTYSEMQWRIPF